MTVSLSKQPDQYKIEQVRPATGFRPSVIILSADEAKALRDDLIKQFPLPVQPDTFRPIYLTDPWSFTLPDTQTVRKFKVKPGAPEPTGFRFYVRHGLTGVGVGADWLEHSPTKDQWRWTCTRSGMNATIWMSWREICGFHTLPEDVFTGVPST